MFSASARQLIGVDEAGRGPLAGPVAVGVVAVAEGFDVAKEFPGVKDSKQLSARKRELFFEMLTSRVAAGDAQFVVEFESADAIDEEGITVVIRRAVSRGVNVLARGASPIEVLLDGALRAPSKYRQRTIIDGDETVALISLASIAAKVTRDRLMVSWASTYPLYGFEKHKGYGTVFHYDMLGKYGPCALHRRSYLHLANDVEMK